MLITGLAAQSEISQLLDELYGRLDRASLDGTGDMSVISHSGDGVPSIPGKRKSAHEESIESFALEVKQLRAGVTLQ